MAAGSGAVMIAGVGGAGAASSELPPDASAASADRSRLDYRETEHVRWFYRRARM